MLSFLIYKSIKFRSVMCRNMGMKKILFVDDDRDLHPTIVQFFPKEEYRVICASDGLEGLHKCRNEDFDYIILDYKLPKLDGAKFYQQLRDLQVLRKSELSPVIFVGENIDEIKNMNIKFEKCEFLSKPFTRDDLIQKMTKTTVKIENKVVLNVGDVLFKEGDDADCMYYVAKGLLECSSRNKDGTSVVIGTVGPGELIGEMAVIMNEKRVLTVKALEKTELVGIPSSKVMAIVNDQPKWIKLMLENLSRRLKNAVKQIS